MPLHVRLRHAEPPHETVRLEAPPATAVQAQAATPAPAPKRLERHAATPSVAAAPVLAGTSGESPVQQSETGTAPAKTDTGTVATQAPTEPRQAEADTPDPQALAGFGRAFSSLLAARQQYPRLAAMRGWEGEVRLRVHIAMKGNIVSILLVQSSGFELLDQAAIKLVEACSQLPPLPLALQGHDFDILVPVQYRLARAG